MVVAGGIRATAERTRRRKEGNIWEQKYQPAPFKGDIKDGETKNHQFRRK